MAAELPVKDVLCEAMDYLSKLGSNLRTRSETLKDKRKDKLNNTLAVQKVADKVLLICELSKKSLDNVETGVRKILEQIDSSQSSKGIGGKFRSKTDKIEEKQKYHYFDYKSRTLKIKNKISIKHFKSVKVFARKMDLSKIAKYPVYFDCTLYRTRLKEDKINIEKADSVNSDCEEIKSSSSESNRTEIVSMSKARRGSLYQNVFSDSHSDNSDNEKSYNSATNKTNSNTEQILEKKSKEPDPKRPKLKKIDSDDENASQSSLNGKDNTDIHEMKDKKPMIKCVSINKLLKPDLKSDMNKSQSLPQKASKTDVKKNTMLQKSNLKSDNMCSLMEKSKTNEKQFDALKKNKMLERSKKRKDALWESKRNEVESFKPKEFSVHITRLPNITAEFLIDHGIKKVMKHGEIYIEQNDNKNKSKEKSNDSEYEHTMVASNKVKDSLLHDSESENESQTKTSEKVSETTVDRIKSALLNSDSDQNNDEVSENNQTQSVKDKKQKMCRKKIRDSIHSDSSSKSSKSKHDNKSIRYQSDNNLDGNKNANDSSNIQNTPEKQSNNGIEQNDLSENVQKITDEHTKSKTFLLNDSSNDEEKESISEKKTSTPQSKEKRNLESVQVKTDLLRYSTSSDDEALRNTINNVKQSLLAAISDDESIVEATGSKSPERSSSSEDLALKVKKKKHSKSKSSKIRKERSSRRENRCCVTDSESEDNSSNDKSTSKNSKMVRSKSKPGSSYSSDAQDHNDKEIDGLTNLTKLNESRRRGSESDDTQSSKSKMSTKPMTKAAIGEDILKAESSSDNASDDEGDAGDEELPSVTISGFNGGPEHLLKEDLLVDSDSSTSLKEEKDESEEEQVSSKRRKPNAIASSDSEAGTGRKKEKDEDARLSDFEDSEDSEVTRRAKRKKKGSDSDASESSDSKQKKRRRIKAVDESEGSGSDSENEGKNKHGRKNIRKVMGKSQLEEATKKAAREEKERVARIAERQKMYNNLQFDESGKPDEVVLDRVVLDFDPETKEPLIAVDKGLVNKLKPHQANGIKFMWDACFESVKRIKKAKGSGCILAHCMGLGKTLQVVALTHTLLAHGSLTRVQRVLVVCPLSTVLNWVNEFNMWLRHADRENDIDVYELSRFKQNSDRAYQLSLWFENGGVCVLGYEMFRNLSADNNKKFKKKMLKNFQEALVDPGPDLVVCDEGHLLKNEKTSLSQSMNKVKTLRRIVLTGTPLQNNLKEYYCMVQFVKPNLLGKYNEYLNRFVNPITNGQYTDSTEHDIKIMKRRSHVLHKMLDGAVQRRDYGVLAPFLPPKHEYVLFITLTDVQVKLYQHYLDNYSRRPLPGKSSGFLFPDFQSLQRIWTHPLVLKYNSDRYEIMQQKKRDKEEEEDSEGSLVDFIDDDSTASESSSEDSSGGFSDVSDDSRKKSKKKKSSKKSKNKDKEAGSSRRRGTRANPIDLDLEEDKDDDILEVKNENPTEWWIKMVEEDELEDVRNSHKLVLLFDILRQCEAIGDKLLVFSQSLYSLDLIEHFLGKVDEATQEGRIDEKLGGHVGSWSQGIDYFRLDGSTSCENRSIWCKNFNREDNPRARLFLISTRAGGLGINLVAANRVVIFDVSWNPSHDVQSIFRVYRFGQKKPCYIYRFLAMGTMEEKIYERQVTKQAISKRVIDEQQIDRHYAENDLAELYKFEAEPPSPRPLPPLPKDRLFAEMLREHDKQIYRYHEHDSLLENKEEETLSEEERKAAWEDFENEKNRPPPAPFPQPWQMNGMMPNMLAQQQQQLAYAALAAMLRKDMPNVNDNQIRDMLPMIYNANPALMQKMNEILKYSQHMNMGPMMGQGGMNSASSGAMGSTSALQYEPPWQRQQQQQQQLRLQQIMAQQQQTMGAAAKFYAGGLGSRDPVAMALQQQQARAIMSGGAANRPRGRPPLQARAPPPAADVVNLDSD